MIKFYIFCLLKPFSNKGDADVGVDQKHLKPGDAHVARLYTRLFNVLTFCC